MKYRWIDNDVLLEFLSDYGIEEWGEMLELNRSKEFKGANNLILDYSKVTNIGDMGLDVYILRDEFREQGGKNIYLVGLPESINKIFSHLGEENISEKILRFKNLDEILNYLNQ